MPGTKKLILGSRLFFVGLLILAIFLAWEIGLNFQIDTNLEDVSPQTQKTPETVKAVQQLRASIEQRIILLLSGDDEDQVYDAEELIRSKLESVAAVSLVPNQEALAERLLSGLKPYRFSLLTDAQLESLKSRTPAMIAAEAQERLFKMTDTPQLFSFDEDPLGWHNNTFSSLLSSSQSGMTNSDPDQGYALTLTINIAQGAMNMRVQEALLKQIDQFTNQVEQTFAVKLERSGVFFFAADAAKSAKHDISLISAISSIGVVILLLFAFGTFRTLALPVLSILLGVGFAFIVTHSLYGTVHVLTIVFGACLIGIVIDYSLHYFYHRSASYLPAENIPAETGDALYRALFLSLMTSMIGYAALGFSELAALQKVAIFSCCGLLMAWLSVICLGELATRKPIPLNQKHFPAIVAGLARMPSLLKQQIWLLLAATLVIGAALILKFGSPFNDDPRIFFKPSATVLASEQKVSAVANDYEPGRYLVINGQDTAKVYARYHELMDAIAGTTQLNQSDLSSMMAWVAGPQQQRANYQYQSKLYQDGGAATLLAQAISGSSDSVSLVQSEYRQAHNRKLTPDSVTEMFADVLPPFWVSNTDRNGSKNIVSFVLIRKGVNADALDAVAKTLDGIEYVNTLERTRLALSEQRESASKLLVIAYLLIGLLMMGRYRSINALWMVAIPFCASAAFILLSAVVGFSLNLFHTMALFLVLGFGMDYTIFTREMSDQSGQQRNLTMQAIVLSALTSLLSFGLLSISSIPVVASFGLTLLLGNLFNLTGVFIAAHMLASNATGRLQEK